MSPETSILVRQVAAPFHSEWIVRQAHAGMQPEVVLADMVDAGWESGAAILAMEQALLEQLTEPEPGAQPAPAMAAAPQSQQPLGAEQIHAAASASTVANPPVTKAAVAAQPATPGPRLEAAPVVLSIGRRRVHVRQSIKSPHLVVLDGFLSAAECDHLVALAQPRLATSMTVDPATGADALNPNRTSLGMFLNVRETALVAKVERRIAQLLNWPEENGEPMQVLRYLPGAQYTPHYDYFDPSTPGAAHVARGGQRVATFLMYLREPESGGATSFPDIGLEIMPRRGSAVFFAYPTPDPSSRTLHGGRPVAAGEKWVATKWLRASAVTASLSGPELQSAQTGSSK